MRYVAHSPKMSDVELYSTEIVDGTFAGDAEEDVETTVVVAITIPPRARAGPSEELEPEKVNTTDVCPS